MIILLSFSPTPAPPGTGAVGGQCDVALVALAAGGDAIAQGGDDAGDYRFRFWGRECGLL